MHFRKALTLLNDGNILRKAGEAYEGIGNVRKAETLYLKSIDRNRRHPAAYVELIGMYIEQKRFDEADLYLSYADTRAVKHLALEQYRLTLLSNRG